MIETHRLCRSFGPVQAVKDLDLTVADGELFGFLGPNGAGKTTTISMLCGLLRPTSGTLRIDGRTFADDPEHIRRLLGLVPDTPPLYEYLTARQYIAFVASLWGIPPARRDAESERLLHAFDLADRADELIRGYSFGMKKKVHLAAVLATGPRLLLLDEPTIGLDPRSARRVKDLLRELRDAGVTVFLSTHHLDTAEELCDRVGILAEGALRAVGRPDELRRDARDRSLEDIFLRLTQEAAEERRGAAAAS